MAFKAQTIRHPANRSRAKAKPISIGKFLRRSAVPGATAAGIILALASLFAPAPARHADTLAAVTTSATTSRLTANSVVDDRVVANLPIEAVSPDELAKTSRLAAPAEKSARAATPVVEDRFDKIVKSSGLTPDRLRVVVQNAYLVAGLQSVTRNAPEAATDVASASPETAPVSEGEVGVAALTPDVVPVPQSRPRLAETAKPAEPEKPAAVAAAKPEKPAMAKPEKPGLLAGLFRSNPEKAAATEKPAKPTKTLKPAKPEVATAALAFARPDAPDRGISGAFNGLFNKPNKPGNRTAIYDISAGVVIMPNGERLEAHSGIGKMADNPRYVHVKMNGPTPPNTYKLSMREKRFHGVEAIRMTPIGSEPMHGRNGILAHSYLLRGRAGQSHGCVAFKDYNRFLKAFKAGQVTHMIVVPGGGGSVRRELVAANDV